MKRENNKSGIYITACCLAVIAAVIAFSSKRGQKESNGENTVDSLPEVQAELTESEPVLEVEKVKKDVEDIKEPEAKSAIREKKVENANFVRPVAGKILEEFSNNDLIYNEALKDWRVHSGVDLEAEFGEQVIAAANGIVEKVFDSNMGKCVEIDHQNGYKTIYANLDENIQIKQGDEVAEGDVIGLVGNTALGDATDIPHLHFEITKDGENVNPKDYFE